MNANISHFNYSVKSVVNEDTELYSTIRQLQNLFEQYFTNSSNNGTLENTKPKNLCFHGLCVNCGGVWKPMWT